MIGDPRYINKPQYGSGTTPILDPALWEKPRPAEDEVMRAAMDLLTWEGELVPQEWTRRMERLRLALNGRRIVGRAAPNFLTRTEWLMLGLCLGFWIGVGFTIILPCALQ